MLERITLHGLFLRQRSRFYPLKNVSAVDGHVRGPVFKPAHSLFHLSSRRSLNRYVLSSLNDITVTVTLDSTSPVSLVIPRVVFLLKILAAVTVSCQPVEAVRPFCCILDLG